MALMTERGIKRHKVAVLTVEERLDRIDRETGTADFEWFNTPEAAAEWTKDWLDFCKKDTEDFTLVETNDDPAMAYLTIVIEDTSSMDITEVHVFPDTPATQQWRDDITADVTVLFEKKEEAVTKKKPAVVKPRAKKIIVGGSKS